MDDVRARFEALERRTQMVERRRRWWRGVAPRLFARRVRRGGACSAPLRRWAPGLLVLWAIGMVLGWVTAATATDSIRCGDTLGPGGTFRLQADLDCGEMTPALTVRDGPELDLGGHRIVSLGSERVGALHLTGQGAVLHNGTVSAGLLAISVAGRGGHTVRGVVADGITGILVSSDGNRLLRTTVEVAGQPFIVEGRRNLLVSNVGGGQGAFAVTGDNNRLFDNLSPGQPLGPP